MSEANRFFIAERYADNGELSHRALVDAADGRELGTDGGEPEDQSFWRDWAWVPDEMNKLGNEIVTLRDERDRLRSALERISTEHCAYKTDCNSPYDIGVVDGHRCAATIAKAALTSAAPPLTPNEATE